MVKKGKTQNLKPFKKGQSGNPKGRPPKTMSAINAKLKAEGHEVVTPSVIYECFSLLIGLNEDKLKEIIKDTDNPRPLRLAAEEMLGKNGWDIIEKMLDRAHGKARQSVDVTSQGERIEAIIKWGDREIKV